MVFNEIYSSYYNVMAKVIQKAVSGEITWKDIAQICAKEAFQESSIVINEKIRNDEWQIINRDLTTNIGDPPTMPLTLLQKRWLKSISLDKRFGLFGVDMTELGDIKPLFGPEDYYIYDSYGDGDPYDDPVYVETFRKILYAIREEKCLGIQYETRMGSVRNIVCKPKGLEYSLKDDKFRVVIGRSPNGQLNIQRIRKCSVLDGERRQTFKGYRTNMEEVEFEVRDRRNALERVMLEFACYKKEAERIGDSSYMVRIWYDRDDRTEILIRLLSFGPVIKVTGPDDFRNEIKERLLRQKNCGL